MGDRVALVTGAARGIGAATVGALLAQGYRVVAVDGCAADDPPPGIGYRLADRADLAAVAALDEQRVLPAVADVRDRAALDRAVAEGVARFGRLDAAVAAAGVVAGGSALWATPDEQVDALFDVNARGVWNTAAATIPALLAGDPGGARFVAVASVAGEQGLRHLAAYTAAKHAVVGIVRGLAADLAGTGATAVAVAPGSTDTAMLSATADLYGTTREELAGHQALRRALAPAEIAAAIAFCCSPAGAALNGSVVRADGGFGS